jgi:hypothetical protein
MRERAADIASADERDLLTGHMQSSSKLEILELPARLGRSRL